MNDKTIAEKLFQELGPLLDPAAIVYDETEPLWAVVIDETTRIDVAYDDDAGQFVFALDLGEVPDQSAERVHALLLRFSGVWRETGGLHTALDGEGRALLMYRHPVQGLDVQRLQTLMGNLAVHRRMWADLIASSETEELDPDTAESAVPFTGIRV